MNQGLTNELSQVSLGIYTDYGSTIIGMDSMVDDGEVATTAAETAAESAGAATYNEEAEIDVGGRGVSEEKTQQTDPSSSSSKHRGGGSEGEDDGLGSSLDHQTMEMGESSIVSADESSFLDPSQSQSQSQGQGQGQGQGPGAMGGGLAEPSMLMPYLEEGEEWDERRAEVPVDDTVPIVDPVMPNPPKEEQILRRGVISANGILEQESFIDALRGVKVTGRFRYTPGRRHVMPGAGIYPIRAVFVPDDQINIGSAEISVNVTVLRARPVVTWNQPQPIFAGTALSKLQLCAQVSCPGLREGEGYLEYFPNRGEILPAGMHVLRCRFVPFKFAAPNFDCKNSWAEVPVLVKPKPFNMAYLDNLAPPKTGIMRRKLPPGDTGSVDTTRGRGNWVSGMPLKDPKMDAEARAQTAGAPPRGVGTSGLLGLNPPRPSSSSQQQVGAVITTAREKGRLRQTGSSVVSGARSRTAPNAAKSSGDLSKHADEFAVSPRTQRDMSVLAGNIQGKEDERVRSATALIGTDVAANYSGTEMYDGDYIETRQGGKGKGKVRGKEDSKGASRNKQQQQSKRPHTTTGAASDVSDQAFYTQDSDGNHVQIDSFGRVMPIDPRTIDQYLGKPSNEYDNTLYKDMDAAGNFASGIPAMDLLGGNSNDGGSSSGSVESGATREGDGGNYNPPGGNNNPQQEMLREGDGYLTRNLTPYSYKVGTGSSKERLFQLRAASQQGSRAATASLDNLSSAAGSIGGVGDDNTSFRSVGGTEGGDTMLPGLDFGSAFGEGASTSLGGNDFVAISGGNYNPQYPHPGGNENHHHQQQYGHHGQGYSGYGYSRSPSPEPGTHLGGSTKDNGRASSSYAHFGGDKGGTDGSMSIREEKSPAKAKKKKKAAKRGEYQMSESLALGTVHSTRKPQTAPGGTMTRNRGANGKSSTTAVESPPLVMPVMHFGTGNTGKHTMKKDMDSNRKAPSTKPFKWSYFVDVKNVFESDNKPKVAGEKEKKDKKASRDGRYLPLDAPVGLKFGRDGVDMEQEEANARRQLVKLERQINSLRRDALGVAKMVQYTEEIREREALALAQGKKQKGGEGGRPGSRAATSEGRLGGGGRGRGGKNTTLSSSAASSNNDGGNYDNDGDNSVGSETSQDRRALRGLERVPGIGTGAARRIATSYEYENPYMDLTMPTGAWASAPTSNYASATMASDRLTDTAKQQKLKQKHQQHQQQTQPAAGSAVNLMRGGQGQGQGLGSPIKRPGSTR
jgi:hypothetical protein